MGTEMSDNPYEDTLAATLREIHRALHEGLMPSVSSIDTAIELLTRYEAENLHRTLVQDRTAIACSWSVAGWNVVFRDVIDRKARPSEMVSDLERNNRYPGILFEMGMRKLALRDDPIFADVDISLLVKRGYVAEVQIQSLDGAEGGYAITSKGVRCLRQKGILQKASHLKKVPSFPTQFAIPFADWSKLAASRAYLLQKYYAAIRLEEAGYDGRNLLFTFYGSSQMVFGCRIDGRTDTRYEFAVLFEDKPEESELEVLRSVCDKEDVSELKLIAQCRKDAVKLQELLRLDDSVVGKVTTYVLNGESA